MGCRGVRPCVCDIWCRLFATSGVGTELPMFPTQAPAADVRFEMKLTAKTPYGGSATRHEAVPSKLGEMNAVRFQQKNNEYYANRGAKYRCDEFAGVSHGRAA